MVLKTEVIKFFKAGWPSLLFYTFYSLIALILEKLYPSGPCTPRLGIMLFLFLPAVTITLLIKVVLEIAIWQKPKHVSAIIHFIILLAMTCFFLFATLF
jgi:hypothetical protein